MPKRVIGGLINRAVKEILGSRDGHNKLRQHVIPAMGLREFYLSRPDFVSDSEPVPGEGTIEVEDLTGRWIWGVSVFNGTDTFA